MGEERKLLDANFRVKGKGEERYINAEKIYQRIRNIEKDLLTEKSTLKEIMAFKEYFKDYLEAYYQVCGTALKDAKILDFLLWEYGRELKSK